MTARNGPGPRLSTLPLIYQRFFKVRHSHGFKTEIPKCISAMRNRPEASDRMRERYRVLESMIVTPGDALARIPSGPVRTHQTALMERLMNAATSRNRLRDNRTR
jgi:hypothetical protein